MNTSRWDPRVKLLGVLGAAMLVVVLEQPFGLLLLLGVGVVTVLRAGLSAGMLRSLGVLLGLLTWGTLFSQSLFYAAWPRTVWVTLIPPGQVLGMQWEGLFLMREGASYGAVQALRFLAPVLLGVSLCTSESPERLFAALRALRLPYGLGFMGMTALRFVPLLVQELLLVRRSRRLRGYRPWALGISDTLSEELRAIQPVLVKALRRAGELSASLALRGFDPVAGDGQSGLEPLTLRSRLVMVGLLGGVTMVVSLRALFLLYVWEVYSDPRLLGLYAWVRRWL